MSKSGVCALSVIVLATMAMARPAQADNITFNFSGDGISGQVNLTYSLDTISGDPLNANNVTAVYGYFSDANVTGINNWQITGLTATDPNPSNAPFATSLSYFPVTGNVLSYDNLVYVNPSGAPDTCFDGVTGGFLDVFGLMLTAESPGGAETGEFSLWSDGGGPNVSPIYGAALVNSADTETDYQFEGITLTPTPEPAPWLLLGTGLIGLFALKMRKAGAARDWPVMEL